MAMAARVKGRVVTVVAIARTMETIVAMATAATTLPVRAASSALPSWPSFYNPWTGIINMYPGPSWG
jgi:hypothetical protein